MRCPWLRQRDSPPLVSPLLLWRLFTLATEAVSLTLRATHAEFLAVAEHELLVWYLRSWPPSDAVQVAQLIDSNYYDWRRLWEARDEEAARQRELLPLAEDTRLHPTIFSVSKLQRCSLWRKALLRPGQLYRGRLGLDTFNPRHFTFVHRQLLLDSMRAQYPLIGEQYDGYIDDSLTDQMSGRESAAVSTAPSATSKSWSASPFSWQRYMLEGMNSHEQSKLLASGWIIFDGDHLPEHLLVCKGNAVSLRTFLRQQLLPTLPRDLWPVQLIRMLAYQQRLGSSSSRLRGRFSSFICALQAVIREDVGMTKLSELAMQWQEFCGPLSTRKARATEVDSHSQLISKIIHQLRSLYEVRIAAVTSQEGSQSSAIASWEAPHILATIIDVLSPHLEACTAFTLFDHLVWVLETGQAQGVMERPLQQMITRVNCLFWEAEGDIPRQSLLSFRASHQSRWREQRFLKWQRDNRSVAMANYRSLPLVQPPSHHRWPVISGLRYALIGRFGRGRVELNMLIDEHQALTPRFEPQIRVDGLLKDLIDFVYSTPGVLFDEQRRWLAEKDWPTFVLLVRALRWSLVNGWHLDMTPFPDRNSLHTFSLAQAQVAFLDHSAPSHDLNTKLETRDSVHAMSMAKVFCRELGSIIERVGWTFIYDRLHQDPHMPAPRSTEEGGPERPSKEGEHYSIIRKIGEGSFGVIYLGKSDLCPSDYVAIKFESRKSVAPQLRDEYRTYKNINARLLEMKREGVASRQPDLLQGIPRVYYYGQETLFNYLILDYLGDSLEDKFDRCGRRFSVKTTAFLAIQMITRVQTIHKNSYIYRDIKPDNFLLGRKERGEERLLYVVDFGMAKHFENPATRQHIPYREKKSLSGTARYMSINTHLGREQSRRDDMEALGNVFLYFLRGSLPWQGLKARDNREKYERIGQKKQAIRIDELCAGFPPEFAKYVAYTRRLGFEEEPDYEQCREWFRAVYAAQSADELLDWERIETEGEEKRPAGGASHYESPQSHPNHLPMTGMRSDARARADGGAGNHHQPQCYGQPHSSNKQSSAIATPAAALPYHRTTNTSPIFGQPQPPFNGKKSLWRRIFCLSQRG